MGDVIIIGGGTAGLTAAIYLQRSALQSVVLEAEDFGGRIFPTLAIDNFPAMPGISGADYSEQLRAQAEALGAELIERAALTLTRGREQDGHGESFDSDSGAELALTRGQEQDGHDESFHSDSGTALTLTCGTELWEVTTAAGKYVAPAVIYAAGEKQRPLGVPGEAEFLGRGVAYCAACDGAFFRGKDVALVGGGDKALDDALTLSRLCATVHLIHRRDEFRAAGGTVAQVKETPNIVLHMNRVVTSIAGDRRVSSVTLRSPEGGDEEILAVPGIFVAVGSIPQTALCADLIPLDKQGYIIADEDCMTPAPGLFVAGDVRKKPLRQLVTAAADGAVAAKAAADYITRREARSGG